MKKVECIVSHKKFQDLEQALRHWGIRGITVTEVRGYGNEQTRPEAFLLLPKLKVEVFCTVDDVDDIVAVMAKSCRTGQLGDGKIAVYDVENLVRIRTGERGEVAV
jgi:nitrogen regulatory protein P-II 1